MLTGRSFRPQTTATPVSPSILTAFAVTCRAGGRVWFPARTGTKNISRIQFLWSTVTKTAGSGIRVSLQDPTANNSTFQGDGTDDQYVDVGNSDAKFVSGTWYRTAPLSATRTVNFGDELVVVWAYDPLGHKGSDAVSVALKLSAAGNASELYENHPNVLLEFDDGTYGTLFQGYPTTDVQPTGLAGGNLTGVGQEFALEFSVPRALSIDGCTIVASSGNSSHNAIDVILYDYRSSVLRSTTIDKHWLALSGGDRTRGVLFSSKYDLVANKLYRLAIKATATDGTFDVRVRAWKVDNADHFSCHVGGKSWRAAYRTSGGCWTTSRKARPHIYPLLASW
jgi:hypothetical protein